MKKLMLSLPAVVNGRLFPRGTVFPNAEIQDVEAISGKLIAEGQGFWLTEEPIVVTETQKQEIITFVKEAENTEALAKKEKKEAKAKEEWRASVKKAKEL
jgi:hypothetical protein